VLPDRLPEVLAELPEDGEVVAYCRGPFCVFADLAVRALRARGRTAYRLVDGYPDWRLRGATEPPT
jgi:rhodanese-related sulfurtransferase